MMEKKTEMKKSFQLFYKVTKLYAQKNIFNRLKYNFFGKMSAMLSLILDITIKQALFTISVENLLFGEIKIK